MFTICLLCENLIMLDLGIRAHLNEYSIDYSLKVKTRRSTFLSYSNLINENNTVVKKITLV